MKIAGSSEGGHRIAYRLFVGEIPDGMLVLHKCDNSVCIEPSHLELGSDKENATQKAERLRAQSKLTPEDVATIRARYKAGEFQRVIAKDYGLHQGCVSHIVNRDYWDHV
jgi:hypothetical protein